jgi:hypothetical protein
MGSPFSLFDREAGVVPAFPGGGSELEPQYQIRETSLLSIFGRFINFGTQ